MIGLEVVWGGGGGGGGDPRAPLPLYETLVLVALSSQHGYG